MYKLNENNKVSILDIKKGSKIKLKNGWEATVMDNQVRKHTRLCEVYGIYTEIGSVYSTDIVTVIITDPLSAVYPLAAVRSYEVDHTPTQKKGSWMRSETKRACDPTSELYHSM
jgi:hypothetical protein